MEYMEICGFDFFYRAYAEEGTVVEMIRPMRMSSNHWWTGFKCWDTWRI